MRPASEHGGEGVFKPGDAKRIAVPIPRPHALSEPLIDLVELGRGRGPATGKRFAADIVLMADFVIHRDMTKQELQGVRACLRYRLLTLEWRSYVWRIPLPEKHSFNRRTFEIEQRASILPDSLIASVLRYRGALDERAMNLRHVIFTDLVKGLEWACCISRNGNVVEFPAAKLISALEVDSYFCKSNH